MTSAHALIDNLLINLIDRKPRDPLSYTYAYLKELSEAPEKEPNPLTDAEIGEAAAMCKKIEALRGEL